MIDQAILKAFGGTIGPLGLPTTDAVAREVEAALKLVPSELRALKTSVKMPDGSTQSVDGLMRIAVSTKGNAEFDEGERADVSWVNTDSLDRDFEVVLPAGADWKQFKMNPAVTAFHDYTAPPVGRCLWTKREQRKGMDGWLAKTRYTPKPDWAEDSDWYPSTIFHMVRCEDMPGKSIGFIPLNYRKPTEKEIVARPEYARARGVIDKYLVLEYAVCTVQSNPDALVEAVSRMVKGGRRSAAAVLKMAGIEPMELELGDPPPSLPDPTKVKYTVLDPRRDAIEFQRKMQARVIKTLGEAPAIDKAIARLRGRV